MTIGKRLLLFATAILLITGCQETTGKGKQNPSKNSLVNITPKAISQSVEVEEDKRVTIALKATDEDGDILGYKVVSKPKHGKLEGKAPNITYIPNKDYNGEDSFRFITNDGLEDSKEAIVTIEIKAKNDKPIAQEDKITIKEDTRVTVDVLSNDIDVDIKTNKDELTITDISKAEKGEAKIIDNKIIYTPNKDYNGEDSITYTIRDKAGEISRAKVEIKIGAVNDTPKANDDNVTTQQAKAIIVDVLSNDVDVDIKTNKDELTITEANTTNNAKVIISGNKITYIPNKDFYGKDSVIYTIRDKEGATARAKINIDVKEHPYITSLSLSLPKREINKDETITPTVVATYSNNTTREIKDIAKEIVWDTTPKDVIQSQEDNQIKFIKNVKVNVKATIKNDLNIVVFSNPIDVDVVWIEDGYILPPEPDPVINNSTLLGIDSNNNGVRDDVEIRIFKQYKKKLHRAYMLDNARVYQTILKRDVSEAVETQKLVTKIINCELYLSDIDDEIKDDSFIENDHIKDYTYNTKERIKKYLDYNIALSGGVYGSGPSSWNINACSDEVKKVVKEMLK